MRKFVVALMCAFGVAVFPAALSQPKGWMIHFKAPPTDNSEPVTVCLQIDKSTAGWFSRGQWKAFLHPTNTDPCERLEADLKTQSIYVAVPGFEQANARGQATCYRGSVLEQSYSICNSLLFTHIEGGTGSRWIDHDEVEKAVKQGQVVMLLNQEIARRSQIKHEQEANEARKERAAYRAAAEAATTLQAISDFSAKYQNNDPEDLIKVVLSRKPSLLLQAYRQAYANADTVTKMNEFLDQYRENDPDGLIPKMLDKREAAFKAQVERERLASKKEAQERARQQAEDVKQLAEQNLQRKQNIRALYEKYQHTVEYQSAQARAIVSNFEISCKASDRRSLPLLTLLYVSARQTEALGGIAKYSVHSRGNDVRIYSTLYRDGKQIEAAKLVYEINRWDELQMHGVHPQAIYSACLGTIGLLWKMPGD